MLKTELRVKYRKKRSLLTSGSLETSSIQIANRLLQLSIWDYSYYHIFLTIAKNQEVDTTFILSILQGKDKNIVVPKLSKERVLRHYLLLDNTLLKKNSLGIPEPEEGIAVSEICLDVVFVPLLAFDCTGNRVGYGGGYYDVFLKKCRPDTVKIGLSFFKAEETIEDITKDDVSLDFCVTPDRTYAF